MKKRLWPICSRNIEHDIGQRTKYIGPQANWTLIVQMIKTFIWDLSGGGDRNKHFKNCGFHEEESFQPIFPCIIECDKPQGTIYKGPRAVLLITLEPIRLYF